MERGFYHPSRGYWQTTGEVPISIRNGYPAGTVEVPIKPGADFDFVDGAWVAVAQEPPPVPQSISRRQAIRAMRVTGIITPEEATAWSKSNEPPAFIAKYLNMLPPDDLADAYEDLAAATEYRIDAPMVSLLGYAAGKTRAEIEGLFRLAATFT